MTVAKTVADGTGVIYVLLPVHSRRVLTEQFVRCLLDQTDQAFHLVLIDDGSTDGTAQSIKSMLPTTTVLQGNGSWWWAGSLQQGHQWLLERELTERDIVLIANDDTRFDPDFLERARAVMSRSRRTLLLAQLYVGQSGAFVELGVHVNWRHLRFKSVKEPDRVNCLSTRGLFAVATEFTDLGGFHPRLLPHYLSDYEFTIRAHRAGFELASDPGVKLWYDPTTTGIRGAATTSVRTFLRSTLTRRSDSNPFFWTTFLLLACPRRYLVTNVFRVWRRFAVGLNRARRKGSHG